MKQCVKCGKSGLFLKLDVNSLCKDCADKKAAEDEARRQKGLEEARAFINTFSQNTRAALDHTVVFPEMGREKLEAIESACAFAKEHAEDWKKYDFFQEIFETTLQKNRVGRATSTLFPRIILLHPENPAELFETISKKASDIDIKAKIAIAGLYDYSKIFRIAGVTFSNGKKSRQSILKAIANERPPYDGPVHIRLKKAKFEDEDAVEVYANSEQVGYIARTDLPWLLEHWSKLVSVRDFDIHGGEDDLCYGMDIKVGFNN